MDPTTDPNHRKLISFPEPVRDRDAAVLADQHRDPSGDSSFEDLLDNGIQRGLRVQGVRAVN
jgi:hypothetical protein